MFKIIIVNGVGTSGKDEFIKMIRRHCYLENYSSVDKVKEAGMILGWDGISKTEKDREFLSDLKVLASEYSNHSFEYIKSKIDNYKQRIVSKQSNFICSCIREPLEIEKFKQYYGNECVTVLIRNNRVPDITSNMADANVEDYNYEYVIYNEDTLEELEESAKLFLHDLKISN